MRLYTPGQLLIDQLRDLLSVEEQLAQSQPALIELSTHDRLRELLRRHHEETRGNVTTLNEILERLHAKRKDDHCQAMDGLLRGGEAHLLEVPEARLRDLMMIAHCLRIEGYEIIAHDFTSYLGDMCDHQSLAADVYAMLGGHAEMQRELQNLKNEIFDIANRTET